MIIKMLSELKRRMNEHCEKFNKELENIKKTQTAEEYNNWNLKNTLEGINSRLDDTEECISELVDKSSEIHPSWTEKKRTLKSKDSLRDLWDNNRHTNIHIIGVPEGEEREKGTEDLFEVITAKNFSNLRKETDIQV